MSKSPGAFGVCISVQQEEINFSARTSDKQRQEEERDGRLSRGASQDGVFSKLIENWQVFKNTFHSSLS